MPCRFKQCLLPVNRNITESCSQVRLFRHLSKPPLLESIISEILKLEDSPFFWKCSPFHVDFRNAKKNPENVFCFKGNGFWTCCVKVCILRREYVYSAVNVFTNRPNILDLTKADIFQLNLSQIHGKKRIIVVPCRFKQCLLPVNSLIIESCSEVRLFRHLSNHLF